MGRLLRVCLLQTKSGIRHGSCALKVGEQSLLVFEINTKLVIIEGLLDTTEALCVALCVVLLRNSLHPQLFSPVKPV